MPCGINVCNAAPLLAVVILSDFTDLEDTGWSLQSDSIDLDNAAVTITRDDGTDMPVTVTELGAYYGSRWAISMIPNGWVAETGFVYEVNVTADGGTIQYRVEFAEC